MSAIPILGVIFAFLIAVVWIAESEHTRRHRDKIEATLRSEEMARGYDPGTYSLKSEEEEDLQKNSRKASTFQGGGCKAEK